MNQPKAEREPLKLCPFCSGKPRLLACHVYCTNCYAAINIFSTPEEAIWNWNNRAPADPEPTPARKYTLKP